MVNPTDVAVYGHLNQRLRCMPGIDSELGHRLADHGGDRGQGPIGVRPINEWHQILLLILRQALDGSDRQGFKVDMVDEHGNQPLAPL